MPEVMAPSDDALAEPCPGAVGGNDDRGTVSRSNVRRAGFVTGIVLAVGMAAFGIWLVTALRGDHPSTSSASRSNQANGSFAWTRPAVSAGGLVNHSGVRIVQVAVTGGGGLVDLRFQVFDPDKAGALHNPATPPAVVDESTGLVVHQLLMSHSHGGDFRAGVTYYLVFENPGNLLHRGSTVSVLLGNAQVEHVKVR